MKLIKTFNAFLKNYKMYVFGVFFTGVGIDIIYSASISDLLFFPLIIVLIYITFVYKLSSKDILKICLGLLSLLIFFYILGSQMLHAERVTTWIFFLLFIGITKQAIELVHKH